MNESIELSGTKLGTREKDAVAEFCQVIRNVPDANIESIILYGSAIREDYSPGKSDVNLLIILDHINVTNLKNMLKPLARGRRFAISPFFITEKNLRSSANAFPVKFLSMQESYQVLWGRDVLRDLEISRQHLQWRCEQEIKNLLLRLRYRYIMSNGRNLPDIMFGMSGSFLENLRVASSLTQENLPSREEVLDIAAKVFEFDPEVLRNVRALRDLDKPLTKEESEQLYDKFMAIVDKVALRIDEMK